MVTVTLNFQDSILRVSWFYSDAKNARNILYIAEVCECLINKTFLNLNFCTSIHNKVKFVSISKFIRFKELPKKIFRLMLISKYVN